MKSTTFQTKNLTGEKNKIQKDKMFLTKIKMTRNILKKIKKH